MKHYYLIITIIIIGLDVNCQKDTIYFDTGGKIIIKELASYYRLCTYDTNTRFPNGEFSDYTIKDNLIVANGNYLNGKKNGRFSIYFNNGITRNIAFYKDDQPFGIWKYFDYNGNLSYRLKFINHEIKILQCYNSSNDSTLDKGYGEFKRDFNNSIIEGKVKNYNMTGIWKYSYSDNKITETYKDGALIKENGKLNYDLYNKSLIIERLLEMDHFNVTEQLLVSDYYRKRDYQRLNCIFKPRWSLYNQDGVFIMVESHPSFPGGNESLSNYISSEIKYPDDADTNGIHGIVKIQFLIDIDEQVKDAKVVQSLGYGCDEIALDIIKNMPDWIPGQQRGKTVPVKYILPIRF